MNSILLWVLFFFIVSILVKRFIIKDGRWFLDRKTDGTYDLSLYRVKETMMSSSERLFFENCKHALGPDYDIYPQVNLDKIFKVDYLNDYRRFLIYLRKINQKSVDFLIVNKNTQSPIFAIELDDSTHNYEDRKKRDSFVNSLFNYQKLPLLRFDSGNYPSEKLKSVFEKYLSYSRNSEPSEIEIVSKYKLKEKD